MRTWAVVVCLLWLGGCSLVPPWAGAEGASLIVTDKTVGDHIVSLASGKNCSTLRVEEDLTYCEEDEPSPHPALYCYRTLGAITCYDRPDPHKGRHQKVDENEHNLVKKR